MNFLAPLAFTFAASIPVVIVFYLLKRKRVVKLVPQHPERVEKARREKP